MQFVKKHWVLLLCGVASIGAIVVGMLGMTSTSVDEEMQRRMQAAAEIQQLRNDPQNEKTISAEKERGQKFEEQYQTVLEMAENINRRVPLMEGVFPEPLRPETPYRFQQVYLKRIFELPRIMKAGTLPTELEVQDEAEIVAEIMRRRSAEEGDSESDLLGGGLSPPGDGGMSGGGRAAPPGMGGGRTAPPGMGGGRTAPPGMGGGRAAPPGMSGGRTAPGVGGGRSAPPAGGERPLGPALPENLNLDEVRHRAAIKKARSIRAYITPETSLHISPVANAQVTPTPLDMWFAQVSLWVQEDMIRAIAEVNEAAAQELKEGEGNVTNMPVKHLEVVRVKGYMTSAGLIAFPSTSLQTANQTTPDDLDLVGESFTARVSDEQFDVVRVVMRVVVDQRDLLKLIDAVTRENFYQLVGLEYSIAEGSDPSGYMYGFEPTVRATLDFEGYLARKVYKEMMPATVLKALGIEQQQQ